MAGGCYSMMDWASGDDFRDGAVGVIAIFLVFWAFFFWPHMQKRVKGVFVFPTSSRFTLFSPFILVLSSWLALVKYAFF